MSTPSRPTRKTMYGWQGLPWKEFERQVFKLQKRIYRASVRDDVRAVHELQKLLLSSFSAKCLAVRRVTQDNRGKRTAGVDGVASLTPRQRLRLAEGLTLKGKALPLRRVWIAKPGSKDGEKRPLGIPTMRDRALQALAKLALEPEWEARFEPNSYGFRPGRSCHDAIEAIFNCVHRKPRYVLDADIEGCFERINHEALIAKLSTFPVLRRSVKGWLKAGIMDGATLLFPTAEGTPQGGVISPLLANVALHGLEGHLTSAFPAHRGTERWRPKVVRYADDFVVLHHDLQALKRAKRLATEWLSDMGLELKPGKTTITHTLREHDGNVGFDFLGFNVRQFPVGKNHSGKLGRCGAESVPLGFKTIIRPSKESLLRHLNAIEEIVRTHKAAPQAALIQRLNPLIRGWANYYRSSSAAEVFQKADHLLYLKLEAWATRRHPDKPRGWIRRKYWHTRAGRRWEFLCGKSAVGLQRHGEVHIRRHVKVQGRRSPYDGDWSYWATRMSNHPQTPNKRVDLLRRQEGRCPWCGLHFKDGDPMEIDHKVPTALGGEDLPSNRQLLHGHCHDEKTALDFTGVVAGARDRGRAVEEPDDGKPSRPVLETSRRGRPGG
jgi:RNA-directed DNA polymerase